MGIALCIGEDCPLKTDCYRFLVKSDVPTFVVPPYDEEKKDCSYFWADII
jgi:hypothetical protein